MGPLRRSARTGRAHVELALDGQPWRSSVLGTLVLRGMRSALAETTDAQTRYVRKLSPLSAEHGAFGPPIHGGAESALPIAVEGWAQCSVSMRAICAVRGIAYVHLLQPTLHDGGSTRLTADGLRQSAAPATWIDGVQRGYPLLRERGARLRDEGVAFVDAGGVFADVDETLYYSLPASPR